MKGEEERDEGGGGGRGGDRSGLGKVYSWIDNCIGAKGSVN